MPFALEALAHYAFHDLGCLHLELADSRVGCKDAAEAGSRTSVHDNYVIDLTQDEDQLLQNMHPEVVPSPHS